MNWLRRLIGFAVEMALPLKWLRRLIGFAVEGLEVKVEVRFGDVCWLRAMKKFLSKNCLVQ